MARITKHRTLSNEELLQYIDAARQVSDIIEELAQRLELAQDSDAIGMTFECPHCEAELTVTNGDDGLEVA
jgi:hypothetical protein